jgi:hypothetical protein
LRNSVKKKSRPSNAEGNGESLRVATPRNSKFLAQRGLIVPDDLDPGEENVPLDFTEISDRLVGALHSRFAVRHAHALYVRASVETRLLRLRRKHKIELAKYRVKKADDFKTARELEASFAIGQGAAIEGRIMELEAKSEIMGAVIDGFESIVKAASREMARRDSERAPRD